MRFTPTTADAIRIAGTPGGASRFISVGELRVLAGTLTTGSLTLSSPNGGETLVAGTTHSITWTASGIASVDLAYRTSSAGAWLPIAGGVAASGGSYLWTVPATLTTQARVQITETGNPSLSDLSNADFAITTPASLTLSSPNGGETLVAGTTHSITWTASGIASVDLAYRTSSAGAWLPIAAGVAASGGSYLWTVPATVTAQAQVQITETGNPSLSDLSDAAFAITTAGGIEPDDVTAQGTPIALITHPRGVGNRNLEVIRDGVFPPVGSTNARQHYDTETGELTRSFDWIGYQFAAPQTFTGLTFQEGHEFVSGGWFDALQVQVRVGGVWTDVAGLVSTPSYTGANGISYEQFALQFTPATGDAIRVAGTPGGAARFISVGELRVLASTLTTGSLTLSSPNGGETLVAGTTHSITWTASGIASVDLAYRTSSAGAWLPIAAGVTASGGSYLWTVRASLTSQAQVQITETGNPSLSDLSDADFAITTPASLTLSSPNGGETLVAGTTHSITWTASGIASVDLAYRTSSAGAWLPIAGAVAASGGSYLWTVPATLTTQAQVHVTETGNPSLSDLSDADFAITTPASLTLSSPNGGETLVAGTTHSITWTASGIASVDLAYRTSSAGAWLPIAGGVAASGGSYLWTVPATLTTQAQVQITETGNPSLSDLSDADFAITTPASLTLSSPNGGETLVAGTTHSITWTASGIASVDLAYRTSSAGAWLPIAGGVAASGGSYLWTVPATVTAQAQVQITETGNPSLSDLSDAAFAITTAGGIEPDDVTAQGTPIALITHPRGVGNRNLEVIRDGVFPPVGSTNARQHYDTETGDLTRSFDWIGYQFAAPQTFTGLTFQEGHEFVSGGWFDALQVQVRVGGVWTDVVGLVSTPSYTGANGISYEQFALQFTPATGDAIRVAGTPGGAARFISVGELRVLASTP